MKYILAFFALAAFAQAAFVDDVDWSTVKTRGLVAKGLFDQKNVVIEERIVGGDIVQPNSIPYQAALIVTASTGTYLCGGVLVSPRHVLTAGHCLLSASQVQVRLGAHFWSENEPSQQRFFTADYLIHEGWDADLLINDIGVVTLQNPAILNEYVQVVPLPSYAEVDFSFAGYIARVSGWGLVSDASGAASEQLRSVETDVMTNFFCNISYQGMLRNIHICTSGAGIRGACTGDSGGPLVADNRLIGIVSFNLAAGCETGLPTVYTRITQFLDWIAANTDAHIN